MIKLFFKSKKTKVGFKGILVFSLLFSFVIFWFCEGLFGDFKKKLLTHATFDYQNPPSAMVLEVASHSLSAVWRVLTAEIWLGCNGVFFLSSLFSLQYLGVHNNPSKKNICVLQFVFIWIFVIILFVTIYFALMLFEI